MDLVFQSLRIKDKIYMSIQYRDPFWRKTLSKYKVIPPVLFTVLATGKKRRVHHREKYALAQ